MVDQQLKSIVWRELVKTTHQLRTTKCYCHNLNGYFTIKSCSLFVSLVVYISHLCMDTEIRRTNSTFLRRGLFIRLYKKIEHHCYVPMKVHSDRETYKPLINAVTSRRTDLPPYRPTHCVAAATVNQRIVNDWLLLLGKVRPTDGAMYTGSCTRVYGVRQDQPWTQDTPKANRKHTFRKLYRLITRSGNFITSLLRQKDAVLLAHFTAADVDLETKAYGLKTSLEFPSDENVNKWAHLIWLLTSWCSYDRIN